MQKRKVSMPGEHDKERLFTNQKVEMKPQKKVLKTSYTIQNVHMTYFQPLDPISQVSHSEHPTDEGSSLIARSLFNSAAALDHVFNVQTCKGIQCLSHSTGLFFRAYNSYAKCGCCSSYRWSIMGEVTATAPVLYTVLGMQEGWVVRRWDLTALSAEGV